MNKGIFLGLLYNVFVAVGLVIIANVRIKNDVLKSSLMLGFAGLVAIILIGVILLTDKTQLAQLKLLKGEDILQISLGAIFVLVIGEALYISGLSISNATLMGYSALAYPATALLIEVVTKRIQLSSLTASDFIGFVFLAIGFGLIITRKQQ